MGDLRLHIETGLAEGIYYLVELSAPDYYTLAEPARFEYHLDDLVQTIRAVNEAVKVRFLSPRLEKTARDLPEHI